MAEWPHGYQFFEHLRDLPRALRLADVPAYLRELGYSEELTLSKTLQAMPIRHRGVRVGNFFLGEKAGGQAFTEEDEEVLVLFASQAATAIANARAHRDEQRARADLEALVETSPVGVVVFDAGTARPVSFNREARRIVGGLQSPDQPVEQLLDMMICRRADGRQVALDEFPLTLSLLSGEDRPRGGDRALRPRRPARRHAGQRDADRRRRWRHRVGGGDHAGSRAARGAGPPARRVPRHGEPRTARAANVHQGFRRHRPERLAGSGRRRDAGVLPHHRRPGRPHARPDRRPAGCRAHRHRHPLGVSGADRRRRPGGTGPQHLPERRRPPHRPDRPAAGATARAGRPAAHRPGAAQPVRERLAALSGVPPHPGRRGARRRARVGLRLRRGPRRGAGAAGAPVPQVLGPRRRRPRRRARRDGAGAGDMQRPGRSPRRPHRCDQRRSGPGHAVHVHAAAGARRARGGGRRAGQARGAAGTHARSGGRRRPADAALRARRARRHRLRPARHGQPGRGAAPHPHGATPDWCCSTWCCPAWTASR